MERRIKDLVRIIATDLDMRDYKRAEENMIEYIICYGILELSSGKRINENQLVNILLDEAVGLASDVRDDPKSVENLINNNMNFILDEIYAELRSNERQHNTTSTSTRVFTSRDTGSSRRGTVLSNGSTQTINKYSKYVTTGPAEKAPIMTSRSSTVTTSSTRTTTETKKEPVNDGLTYTKEFQIVSSLATGEKVKAWDMIIPDDGITIKVDNAGKPVECGVETNKTKYTIRTEKEYFTGAKNFLKEVKHNNAGDFVLYKGCVVDEVLDNNSGSYLVRITTGYFNHYFVDTGKMAKNFILNKAAIEEKINSIERRDMRQRLEELVHSTQYCSKVSDVNKLVVDLEETAGEVFNGFKYNLNIPHLVTTNYNDVFEKLKPYTTGSRLLITELGYPRLYNVITTAFKNIPELLEEANKDLELTNNSFVLTLVGLSEIIRILVVRDSDTSKYNLYTF